MEQREMDDVELIDEEERLNLDEYDVFEIDESERPVDDSGMEQ
jgi:hypothetical protein